MTVSPVRRPARIRLAALLAALALVLLQVPAALASTTVRVTMRSTLALGLVTGRNDTYQLSPVVKVSDGSAPPAVSFYSSASSVVSVDSSGKLTAHKKGAALIRARAGGGYARCYVTVGRRPVRKLTLNRKRITLRAGREGYTLTATPTPRNADNPNVTWRSLKPGVASVDPLTGVVTPLKPGTALIRCRAADGTEKKAYCTVVVKPVMPTALTLDKTELKLNVGLTAPLTATVSPADATDKRVRWYTSNPSVALVSGGTVTGKKFGTATITAKTRSGAIRARCIVRVGYYAATFRALLIGQDTYDSGDLDAPATDVRLVKSMLLNTDFGEGKSVSVTLKENLTAEGIRTALSSMATWNVDSNDVTYFYYSGHGSEEDPGALVGIHGETVSVDEVRRYLDKIPGTVVVMLDSCYSGWFIRNKSTGASSGAINPDIVNSRVVAAFSGGTAGSTVSAKTSLAASRTAAGKYKILTACASTEYSYILYDDLYEGSSLFTYYLATGAGVQAADWEAGKLYADANGNKIVSIGELYRYARPRILNNKLLKRYKIKQSVRVWPANSTFPLVQRTP